MENIKTIKCFGCGAVVPDIEGPTHEYMLSVPGCWMLYGKVLAEEYASENYDPDSHRITVDTYAVTHPGKNERRAVQSVNIHLIRLYYIFERNLKGESLLRVIKNASENEELHTTFEWLEPPSFENTLKITDVVKAESMSEHKKIVYLWGKSVWKVWKDKYGEKIETLANVIKF